MTRRCTVMQGNLQEYTREHNKSLLILTRLLRDMLYLSKLSRSITPCLRERYLNSLFQVFDSILRTRIDL